MLALLLKKCLWVIELPRNFEPSLVGSVIHQEVVISSQCLKLVPPILLRLNKFISYTDTTSLVGVKSILAELLELLFSKDAATKRSTSAFSSWEAPSR